MSRELQPPLLSVSLVEIEPPTVIKNETSESEIVEIGIDDILDSSESEEEIMPDVKRIDIVYHPVCEGSIKSELLESKHYESVETRVLVKAENSTFIKTEYISQKNKTENSSDENVTKGTGQVIVESQGSHEHSNTLSNLETHEQLVLNSSKDLNSIVTRIRQAKHPKNTNFAKCYKTVETTSWEKDKEKIKVIKAPVIPVEAHEYTSLAKDRHVCNHCQNAFNIMYNLKKHIQKIHREVTTMYQCPYCTYNSKWKHHIKQHIIQTHKDTKDIQWFQCHLCEKKFKLNHDLTKHKKVHLTHEQMQDELDLKRHHCDKCNYKTCASTRLKRHELIHLKPKEIKYFYCYHCSYKSKKKGYFKRHIFSKHFKNVEQGKRYHCDKCDYKTYTNGNLKSHKLTHLKPEEIQYFYCYHCSHKAKLKEDLKKHIFRHFKNGEVKFECYICNFVTRKRESIIEHIKKHSKVQTQN